MELIMSTSVTASEVQKNFGAYHDKALKEPVQITKYGRETAYLVSAQTFNEMWASYRKVLRVGDLSDAEMNDIMQAKVPPEHDYEYNDDPEPDETSAPTLSR
jgi:PHD/YefM family antitoxin component YafN of YafNO toxin-antitoxin module